jgi:lysophospholipase L1-like esterase
VAERFQNELRQRQTHSYCADYFFDTAFADQIKCTLGLADQLSKKRKLHLTIDGVHLNSAGARLYKEEVEKALLLVKETSSLFI